MTHTNATTPQLKFMDRLFVAYATRDINNVAPFLSKNFMYRTFPKMDSVPDHTKDGHVEMFEPMFARLAKLYYVFHEEIEAPGKVVIEWTGFCTPPDGDEFEYHSVSIFTLVEEDGELKVLEFKDFADHHKRDNFHETMSQDPSEKVSHDYSKPIRAYL